MAARARAAATDRLAAEFGRAVPSTSLEIDPATGTQRVREGAPASYEEHYGGWHDRESPVGATATGGAGRPDTGGTPPEAASDGFGARARGMWDSIRGFFGFGASGPAAVTSGLDGPDSPANPAPIDPARLAELRADPGVPTAADGSPAVAAKDEPGAMAKVEDLAAALGAMVEPAPAVVEDPAAPAATTSDPVAAGDGGKVPPTGPEPPAVAGAEPPGRSDAGDREAIMELSRQARTPEEQAIIAKCAAEIDKNNPAPMRDSLRDLNIEARADGRLEPSEGGALREWGHEAELDQMPLLDAMHYEGMDRAEVAQVFDKAVGNDAGASVNPGDPAVHTASDGTPLTAPLGGAEGALTRDEYDLLIDVNARRFDELHPAYTTSAGRKVEASPMRKAVNDTQAAEYAAGERTDATGNRVPTDKIGGDVGLRANTEGQSAEGAAGTLGLDYDHASNKYFDPATGTWTPMVTEGGLPVVDFPLTQEMHDKLQVPLGSNATAEFQQHGRDLAASGEYVPELLRTTTAADGTEQFRHLQTRDRQNEIDPRVGFGFSASERALDPETGQPYPVAPNQEYNMPYTPVPDYEVGTIPPASAAISEDPTSSGLLKPGGARYVGEADEQLIRQYQEIAATEGDTAKIAQAMGVDESIVAAVKQHLFVNEYDLPVVNEQTKTVSIEHGGFEPMEGMYDDWKQAQAGFEPGSSKEAEFRRLLAHEYVE